jgi:hypothetical protein
LSCDDWLLAEALHRPTLHAEAAFLSGVVPTWRSFVRTASIATAAVLSALPVLTSPALAVPRPDDEPLQLVQELFTGETVFPQERGELQVSLAPDLLHTRNADVFASGLKLEYGLSSRLQVEAEAEPVVVQSTTDARRTGLGQIEVGLRWSALDIRGSGLHLSLGAGVGVWSGVELEEDSSTSEAGREWETGLVLGHDIGRLQASAGLSAVGATDVGSERGTALKVHGAVVLPFRSLRFSGEVLWLRIASARETYLTPGLTACLARNLEIGLGAALGIGGAADSFRLALRATYEFGGKDAE